MANIKSAKKGILTSNRNRKSNVAKSSKIKTLLKKINTVSDQKEATELLNTIYRELDRIPTQVIHPNKANRLKSQAARNIKNKLEANAAGPVASKKK